MNRLPALLLVLLLSAAAARAFQVTGTSPAAGSEHFNPGDTLRLTFDAPPDLPLSDGAVVIQGDRATYPVAWSAVLGNELSLVPAAPWVVGDRLTVILTPLLTSGGESLTPHFFTLTVRAPFGSLGGWMTRFRLDYEDVHGLGTPHTLAAADFDGDGAVDLAAVFDQGGAAGAVGVARNQAGENDPELTGWYAYDPAGLDWLYAQLAASSGPRVLRAADLDRDGRPDLVVSDYYRDLLIMFPNQSSPGAVSFGAPITVDFQALFGSNLLRDFSLLDLNLDGFPDLTAVFPGTRDLAVARNLGGFTFAADLRLEEIGSGASMLESADFDLDGRPDLAVSFKEDPKVDVFWNQTTFAGISLQAATVITALPGGADGIIAGNLFGAWDGNFNTMQYPDLALWSRGDFGTSGLASVNADVGYFRLVPNLGNRAFATPQDGPAPPYVPFDLVLADLDSTPDPAAEIPAGNWVMTTRAPGVDPDSAGIYFFHDALGPAPEPFLTTDLNLPRGLISFDLDSDGDLDLAVIDQQPGQERILYFTNPTTPVESIEDSLDFGEKFVNPVNPLGLVPIDTTATDSFYVVNWGAYPIFINEVLTVDNPDGVFGSTYDPTPPLQIAPQDSAPVAFTFTPRDTLEYRGSAFIRVLGWSEYNVGYIDLILRGRGGRSAIAAAPDTLDFGVVISGTARADSFRLENGGNLVLDVRHEGGDGLFLYAGPEVDSLPAYSGAWRRLDLVPPLVAADSTILESLLLYDGRFYNDDPLGYPRHLETADSVWIHFRAEVLERNYLPQFVFPDHPIVEGETYTDVIRVYDPNDPSQPVWCDFLGVSSGAPVQVESLTPSLPGFADSLTITYTVDEIVDPAGETASLFFQARDNQFPDTLVDTAWVMAVQFVDDPPRLEWVDGDTTINEGTLMDFRVAAFDEEGDALTFGFGPLPEPEATLEPVAPQGEELLRFEFRWQTDLEDDGTWPFDLWVNQAGSPALGDTFHTTLIVYDIPPDLRADDITASQTSIRINDEVTLNFSISEGDVAPLTQPLAVYLYDHFDGGRRTLWSTDTLDGLGRAQSVSFAPLIVPFNEPGTHRLELYADPQTNPEADTTNNRAFLDIEVMYQAFHVHPQPFTPNQDTFNDTLYFDFGDDSYADPRVNIFTLDGRLLVSLTTVAGNAIPWLGRDQGGRECLPGVYLYTFDDGGRKVASGMLYLAR
ncbi:MAG: hypothetical protein C4524_00825 [Candidatus Zixiibacteriota bacterium]|nr:MAG: hypothetical protein C4524_00825 [candidate division Zixibacteria bacterium]